MRSSLIRWGLCLTLLLAGLPAVPPDRAQAAGTWYVAPQGNDGQDCLSALTPCQTIQGAIGRAAAGDLIKVAVGSYTSSNTEVVLVDRDLTLSGGWEAGFASAAGVSTLDGQQARRGVTVLPGVTAYIERFLIQYGRPTSSGGGVSNQGALTLSAVTIYSSTVAAIGPLGGGVYNTGAITITASTIDDNRAAYGGGLYSSGATVLDYVQVRRNVVTSLIFGAGSLSGGGLDFTDSATTLVRESVLLDNRAEVLNDFGGFTSGMGGGVGNAGTLTLVNTVLAGNRASGPQKGLGGGIFNTGTLSLYNTTVSANTASGTNASGGGLHNSSGTLTLVNSAVAGNASESGTAPDCAGALTSSGYTLIGTLTDCTYTPGPGDLTGVSAGIMRWGDVLQLTTGSQGIDAGDPAGCRDQAGGLLAVDAYGTTRPLDGDGNGTARCDIGASEYDPAHPLQLMFLPCLTRACPPSYWDDFGNPASGWYTGDSPETLYAYAGGEYQLLVRRADYFAAARAPGLQVSDFIATLDVRSVSQTDASYGLIFGLAADWSSFYLFEIDATGWFGLWRYNSNQTWTRLAGGTSAAIQTGSASNRLKVARNGASIQALVNNQLVASVSDSTLTGLRRLAVSVFTYNQPDADIRFDNLLVYPVSCGLGNILAQPSAEAGPASWSGPTDR